MLNAPETPHYANPSHSLQEQFSNRSSHKPHLPCPDTPQQQSRGESTNTVALPPRTSAKYSSSQCLERTSKHPYLLRQLKSSVSKTLLWQSHSPDCRSTGPSLGQCFSIFRQRPGDRHFISVFHPDFQSSPQNIDFNERRNKSIVLNSLRGEQDQ